MPTPTKDMPELVVDIAVEATGRWGVRAPEAVVDQAIRVAWSHMHGAEPAEVSVVLQDDHAVKALNAAYRGQNRATNVLAFPQPASGLTGLADTADQVWHLGDIVIARNVSRKEAAAMDRVPDWHLSHLAVHGFLHLLGYDHRDEAEAEIMESLETAILADLGIDDPHVEDLQDTQGETGNTDKRLR